MRPAPDPAGTWGPQRAAHDRLGDLKHGLLAVERAQLERWRIKSGRPWAGALACGASNSSPTEAGRQTSRLARVALAMMGMDKRRRNEGWAGLAALPAAGLINDALRLDGGRHRIPGAGHTGLRGL